MHIAADYYIIAMIIAENVHGVEVEVNKMKTAPIDSKLSCVYGKTWLNIA